MAKATAPAELKIDALKRGRVTLRMIGDTPLYFNAMSAKAKRVMLVGGAKKTAAERREIKHNPEQEYRDSIHRMPPGSATLLGFPASGIKAAMQTACVDTPGVTKAGFKRLVILPEMMVSIYGKPYLKIDGVRSADMNKTPDMRTRAFLPRWCAEVKIAFVTPQLSTQGIVAVLSNAGAICGIGDFRQEKGAGSFGLWTVLGDDDREDEWNEIRKEARDVQQLAMDEPEYADEETAELMAFLEEERERRAG